MENGNFVMLSEEEYDVVLKMRIEKAREEIAKFLLDDITSKIKEIKDLGYNVHVSNYHETDVNYYGLKLKK